MKIKFVFILVLLFSKQILVAKNVNDSTHVIKNSIYLELRGSALLYSINYDRVFYNRNRSVGVAFRLGVSRFLGTNVIPFSTSVLLGKRTVKMEAGMSICSMVDDGYKANPNNNVDFYGGLIIGLRYQRLYREGILLRLNYIPLYHIGTFENNEIIQGIAISVGYNF